MTPQSAPARAAARWAAAATVGVALAGVAVGWIVVAVDDPDGTLPAASTTSTAPPTTTTVATGEVSLVTQGSDFRIEWHGAVVTADELLHAQARASGTERPPVVLDPRFVAGQREAGMGLGRLEAQVDLLARRLLPVALEAGEGEGELAVVGPTRSDGGRLVVPVMVFNTAEAERRLVTVDLQLAGQGGERLTERVRFSEGLDAVVPARGAYFTTVFFSAEQLPGSASAGPVAAWDADVHWTQA